MMEVCVRATDADLQTAAFVERKHRLGELLRPCVIQSACRALAPARPRSSYAYVNREAGPEPAAQKCFRPGARASTCIQEFFISGHSVLRLRATVTHPRHPVHQEYLQWDGDPEPFDAGEVNRKLEGEWARVGTGS